MSDTIEDYKLTNTMTSNDRRLRRELAQRVLETDTEITFSSHNQGSHLIVVGKVASADFWPGTGLWHGRSGKPFKGNGLEQVLQYVKTGRFKK